MLRRDERAEAGDVSQILAEQLIDEAAAARALAAWWLATYATRMGPLYPRLLSERFEMASALDAANSRPSSESPAWKMTGRP